jgi:ribosomal protein S18 acetylase RimI-like enzyme
VAPPNPPPAPGVRTATTADLTRIEATLGRAFVDDPVSGWLLQRRVSEARVGYLEAVLARRHLLHGVSTVTEEIGSVAIWAPPKRFRVPVRDVLPHLPKIVATLGPAGMRRLLQMTDVEEQHPREPHYYLAVLGTDPDHQGRGLGSAAIAPTMARADEEGVGCYLESSKEANVPFYRRHGFEVTGTHDIAGGKGPRLWLMWRDPRPPGTGR